jgi:hypothetical protein
MCAILKFTEFCSALRLLLPDWPSFKLVIGKRASLRDWLKNKNRKFQAGAMLGSYRRDVRVDPSLPHALGS